MKKLFALLALLAVTAGFVSVEAKGLWGRNKTGSSTEKTTCSKCGKLTKDCRC